MNSKKWSKNCKLCQKFTEGESEIETSRMEGYINEFPMD